MIFISVLQRLFISSSHTSFLSLVSIALYQSYEPILKTSRRLFLSLIRSTTKKMPGSLLRPLMKSHALSGLTNNRRSFRINSIQVYALPVMQVFPLCFVFGPIFRIANGTFGRCSLTITCIKTLKVNGVSPSVANNSKSVPKVADSMSLTSPFLKHSYQCLKSTYKHGVLSSSRKPSNPLSMSSSHSVAHLITALLSN